MSLCIATKKHAGRLQPVTSSPCEHTVTSLHRSLPDIAVNPCQQGKPCAALPTLPPLPHHPQSPLPPSPPLPPPKQSDTAPIAPTHPAAAQQLIQSHSSDMIQPALSDVRQTLNPNPPTLPTHGAESHTLVGRAIHTHSTHCHSLFLTPLHAHRAFHTLGLTAHSLAQL